MADIWNERYMTLSRRPCRGEYPSNNERQGVSRGRSVRQENIKLFHSMLLVTLFVRCLFIAIRISHGKV